MSQNRSGVLWRQDSNSAAVARQDERYRSQATRPQARRGERIIATRDARVAYAQRYRDPEDVSLPYPSHMTCKRIVFESPGSFSMGRRQDPFSTDPRAERKGKTGVYGACCALLEDPEEREARETERLAQRDRQRERLALCKSAIQSHHVPVVPFRTDGVYYGRHLPTNEQLARISEEERYLTNQQSFFMDGNFVPPASAYRFGYGGDSRYGTWNQSLYGPPRARLVEVKTEEVMDVYDYREKHAKEISRRMLT